MGLAGPFPNPTTLCPVGEGCVVAGPAEQVNMHEAKIHLSQLVHLVEEGGEVVISRAGRPVARLVPLEAATQRRLGLHNGEITIHEDFDDPMPEEFLDHFR